MRKKILCFSFTVLIMFTLVPATSFASIQEYEVLQVGDSDEWVFELQEKLIELGYLTCEATGYFGMDTQNALVSFQHDNGLVTDGKAGPATRMALLGDAYRDIPETRISTDAESVEPASSSENDTFTAFAPGDKGDAITEIQIRLKELEYYEYSNTTGYYGPVTEDAVKKFQRTHGLEADGIMGETSYNMLFSDSAKYYTMYPGDSGTDIFVMQEKLQELGYFTGTPTGYYGNVTSNAVRMFQENNGLLADGKAGQQTRNLLFSGNAKEMSNAPDKSTAIASSSSTSSGVAKMIEVAKSQDGKPYSYGSSGPNSYDCAGFVYYVMKNSCIATSRLGPASYAAISNWTTVSDISSLAVGDLVFFKSDKDSAISHMGIYLGGGSFIHASPSDGSVLVSGMSSDYYLRNFVVAKRIF